MVLVPVPSNVEAAADPYLVVALHVVEKTAERGEASGAADQIEL